MKYAAPLARRTILGEWGSMSEHGDAKVTYDSTPWHVCPATGAGSALRFKGGARDGSEVACAACGLRLVYRKPKRSGTPGEQGGRTHF